MTLSNAIFVLSWLHCGKEQSQRRCNGASKPANGPFPSRHLLDILELLWEGLLGLSSLSLCLSSPF